nr:IS1 family transposase [Leptolyngbya ohadii]
MALIPVTCPHCQNEQFVVKNGKTAQGKQRFLCRSQSCQGRTFMLNPSYPGRTPAVKAQIVAMSLNGSGIRDIARVLQVSTRTVMGELKKTGSAENGQ